MEKLRGEVEELREVQRDLMGFVEGREVVKGLGEEGEGATVGVVQGKGKGGKGRGKR